MPQRESIEIQLRAEIKQYQSALNRAMKQNAKFRTNTKREMRGVNNAFASVRRSILGIAGAYLSFRGISTAIRGVIQATEEQQRANVVLANQLRTTGSVIDEQVIRRFAEARQEITTFGDEVTLQAAAVLTAFTNIDDQEVFTRTIAVAQDLATLLGRDLTNAIQLVGRTLDDPTASLGRLSQAGVSLDKATQATIKSLQQQGNLLAAQNLLLDELEKRFKGTAEAAGNTLGGAITKVKNAFGDLFEVSLFDSERLRVSLERLTTILQSPKLKSEVADQLAKVFDNFAAAVEKLVGADGSFDGLSRAIDKLSATVSLLDNALYGAGGLLALQAGSGALKGAGSAFDKVKQIEKPQPGKINFDLLKRGGLIGAGVGLGGLGVGATILGADLLGKAVFDAGLTDLTRKLNEMSPEVNQSRLGLKGFTDELVKSSQRMEMERHRAGASDMLLRNLAVRGAGFDIGELIPEHTQAIRQVPPRITGGSAAPVFTEDDLKTLPDPGTFDRGETHAEFKRRFEEQREKEKQAAKELEQEMKRQAELAKERLAARDELLLSTQEEINNAAQLKVALEQGDGAYKKMQTRLEAINELRATGAPLTEEDIQQLVANKQAVIDLNEQMEQIQEQRQKWKSLGETIGRSFANSFAGIIAGTQSVEDAFRNMAQQIIAQLLDILVVQQLVNSIANAFGAAFLGGGASSQAGTDPAFGPGYGGAGGVPGAATGGAFGAGDMAIVGERGPELVRFGANAQVYPHDESMRMMGGGGTTINQNFYVNVQDNEKLREEMQQVSATAATQASQAMLSRVKRDGELRRTIRGR